MATTKTRISRIKRPDTHDLIGLSGEFITLILKLRYTSDYGQEPVLRGRIKELLEGVTKRAREADIGNEEVQTAIFALIAFLDETIIASDWNEKETWLQKPLQLEYFGRFDAGEEFFSRLERMLAHPKENLGLLKLYFMCMTLGFKGKYKIVERDKLRKTIEETYRVIVSIPDRKEEILSPYGARKGEILDAVAKRVPLWFIGAVTLGIGFISYFIVSQMLHKNALEVIRAILGA